MLTHSILSITALASKMLYPIFLVRLDYWPRYCLGITFSVLGTFALYLGVALKVLWLVYLSAIVIGFGNVSNFLTFLTFVKHFPREYFTGYILGDKSGGAFITLVYFAMDHFQFTFDHVGIWQELISRSRWL